MLNSVVKISIMSAKYFEYYTIILRGAVFSWTHCITHDLDLQTIDRVYVNHHAKYVGHTSFHPKITL